MSSIDSRRLDQSFRTEARALRCPLGLLMRIQTDRRTDKQTDIQTGWERYRLVAVGLTLLLSFVDFGSGSQGQDRKGIWSKACVQEHR